MALAQQNRAAVQQQLLYLWLVATGLLSSAGLRTPAAAPSVTTRLGRLYPDPMFSYCPVMRTLSKGRAVLAKPASKQKSRLWIATLPDASQVLSRLNQQPLRTGCRGGVIRALTNNQSVSQSVHWLVCQSVDELPSLDLVCGGYQGFC